MEKFNFTMDIHFDSYGGPSNINNSWNGNIGNLINHDIDLAACSSMTHTFERTEVVSPGFTLKQTGLQAVFWKSFISGWFSFFEGFDKVCWITLIIVIIFLYVMLNLVKFYNSAGLKSYHWIESGATVAKAFLGNSFDEEYLFSRKSSKAGSILLFTMSLAGFILYSSYMSGLISLLAVQEIKIPFKSLKDLKQYTEFKIGVYGKGSTYASIKRFTEENDMEREFANFISPMNQIGPTQASSLYKS